MVSSEDSDESGALSLLIDLESAETTPMDELTLASVGFKEREDLQRWVTSHPELIAPGLLLITTEFDRWEIRNQKVADRLDALFLHPSGAPVVVEFKRDKATDTVELQALKYAAYCSQLTVDELVEDFASTRGTTIEEAHALLVDHAPALENGTPAPVKILLVAGSFGPAVTSVVLWLREYEIDIGCIEITMRAVPGSRQAVLTARQLLPLPEAEDYLVRRRRKEREEERARQEPQEWTWESYQEQFPAEQVAVAKRVFEDLARYVRDNELPWKPALRSWWLGFKRPGGYYVGVIDLRREKPIEFSVIPDSPECLGLEDPYPKLKSRWDKTHHQWRWAIPTLVDIPDVSLAVELSRRYQPERGPMAAPDQLVPRPHASASGNGPQPSAAVPE
jgi:hypothetical protein